MPAPLDHVGSLPCRIGFLLLPGFSMIALVNALEALRMANHLSGCIHYEWAALPWEGSTAGGEPLRASNGLALLAPEHPRALESCDLVLVCAGLDVRQSVGEALTRRLRQSAARGQALGALCTGTWALAHAGALDGYRCAIHWEHLGAMSERFPRVRPEDGLYVVDRDRWTASGGIAPLHMMLHLVERRQGQSLALAICEQFMVGQLRDGSDARHVPRPSGAGPSYGHLERAIGLMHGHIEEPLALGEVARRLGVSLRQLERLFLRHHAVTPARFYMDMRLRRARDLLLNSDLPVLQVTMACGFQSPSHFSRACRRAFGRSPTEVRRNGTPASRL